MEVTRVNEIIEEAMEQDNPQLIKDIMNEKVEDGEDNYESLNEYFDSTDIVCETIREVIWAKKSNMFLFLKEEYPDDFGWELPLEIVKVETHKVNIFYKGEVEANVRDIYTVNDDGELVLNITDDELEEISEDIDFDDQLGSYSVSAQKGNYDVFYYDAKSKDTKWMLNEAGIPAID